MTSTELVYGDGRVVELVGLDRNHLVRTRKRLVPGGIRWLDSIGRPHPKTKAALAERSKRSTSEVPSWNCDLSTLGVKRQHVAMA